MPGSKTSGSRGSPAKVYEVHLPGGGMEKIGLKISWSGDFVGLIEVQSISDHVQRFDHSRIVPDGEPGCAVRSHVAAVNESCREWVVRLAARRTVAGNRDRDRVADRCWPGFDIDRCPAANRSYVGYGELDLVLAGAASHRPGLGDQGLNAPNKYRDRGTRNATQPGPRDDEVLLWHTGV